MYVYVIVFVVELLVRCSYQLVVFDLDGGFYKSEIHCKLYIGVS